LFAGSFYFFAYLAPALASVRFEMPDAALADEGSRDDLFSTTMTVHKWTYLTVSSFYVRFLKG
jgi:hypothetical protein